MVVYNFNCFLDNVAPFLDTYWYIFDLSRPMEGATTRTFSFGKVRSLRLWRSVVALNETGNTVGWLHWIPFFGCQVPLFRTITLVLYNGRFGFDACTADTENRNRSDTTPSTAVRSESSRKASPRDTLSLHRECAEAIDVPFFR